MDTTTWRQKVTKLLKGKELTRKEIHTKLNTTPSSSALSSILAKMHFHGEIEIVPNSPIKELKVRLTKRYKE